jgi:WD40 repeat protein
VPRAAQAASAAPPTALAVLETAIAKVTDFGLAKKLDVADGPTVSGAIMGTPSYMAPEQASGKGGAVGPAADVYALGVILYEAVAGRPPFKGATLLATLEQVRDAEPVPPARLQPRLPRDLDTICLKCLQKEPARRYPSAAALADDLRRFLAGEPIQARATPAWERVTKWARRRPALAAALAAAAAAVAAALGLGAGLWYNAEQRAAAVRTLGAANEQLQEVGVKLDDAKGQVAAQEELLDRKQKEVQDAIRLGRLTARRHQYVADMLVGPAAWETNNLGRLRELLDKYAPRPDQDDLRGFDWFYLWRLAHGDRLTLAGQTGPVNCVAVSHNGKLIAAGSVDRSVFLWDAATGAVKGKLLGTTRSIAGLTFSPDGATLAVGSQNGTVALWDVATQKALPPGFSTGTDPVLCVAFTPDGGTLAAGTSGGTLKLWDVKTRQQNHSFTAHKTGVQALAFSHDGKTLATGGRDANVLLWDAATGEQRRNFTGQKADVTAVAFSPDDQTLAAAGRDGAVWLWDLGREQRPGRSFYAQRTDVLALTFTADGTGLVTAGNDRLVKVSDTATGQERAVIKGHEGAVTCLALADEGKVLVTGGQDKKVKVWDLAGVGDRTVLPRQSGAALCVGWSPDGKTLACGGTEAANGRTVGLIELWETTGKPPTVWRDHNGSVTGVAFAPDGKTLATGSVDQTVLLWDVGQGKVRFALPGHDGAVSSLAFSRDGKRLASADVNGNLILWDPATGKEVQSLHGHAGIVRCVAFTADGKTLAAGHDDGTVVLWEVEAGKEHGRWTAHQAAVRAVAFSPDGATLATGGDDRAANLWDWTARRQTAAFIGHDAPVRNLAFAPDGRTLVTAAGSVRLWDLATQLERMALRTEPYKALCVAFTRDGGRLAAGTYNGPLLVWDGATDDELRARGVK